MFLLFNTDAGMMVYCKAKHDHILHPQLRSKLQFTDVMLELLRGEVM